jgi:hypothetical protein
MSVVSIYGKKDGNLTIYKIPCFVLVQKCKGSNKHVPDFEAKGKDYHTHWQEVVKISVYFSIYIHMWG